MLNKTTIRATSLSFLGDHCKEHNMMKRLNSDSELCHYVLKPHWTSVFASQPFKRQPH